MMTWQLILIAVLIFLLGLSIGLIATEKPKASGSIVINTLEPDTDRYSIIIRDPIDDLPKKEYVILKVEVMKPQ